jgi:hypothetical protein
MSANVGRNDPCPCGSGLKYKQCCAGKMKLDMKGHRGWVLGVVGLVLGALVAWGLMRSQTRPSATNGMRMPPPSTSAGAPAAPGTSAAPNPVTINPFPPGTGAPTTMSGPSGAAPQAWAYDATTNRHFDPNHGHWHDGPPPPPESRGVASTPRPSPGQVPVPGVTGPMSSGPTPAPWTYDAQKNQHWNPDHGHWHPGPPPAGSP